MVYEAETHYTILPVLPIQTSPYLPMAHVGPLNPHKTKNIIFGKNVALLSHQPTCRVLVGRALNSQEGIPIS